MPDHIRVLSGSSFYEFSCSQVQLDVARFSLLYSSVGWSVWHRTPYDGQYRDVEANLEVHARCLKNSVSDRKYKWANRKWSKILRNRAKISRKCPRSTKKCWNAQKRKPEVVKLTGSNDIFLQTIDSAIIIISSNFVKCFKIMFAIDFPFLLDFIFQASNVQLLESIDQNLYLISCCCLLHFHHTRCPRAKKSLLAAVKSEKVPYQSSCPWMYKVGLEDCQFGIWNLWNHYWTQSEKSF